MNVAEIHAVIAEAERFLDRARDALNTTEKMGDREWLPTSKESGALRRSSMDLTRALADLRRRPE